MKQKLINFHRRIKEWVTQVLFRKFLTPMILVIIYFLILGPTSLAARIFFRNHLGKSKNQQNTNWLETRNYEGDLNDSYNQS